MVFSCFRITISPRADRLILAQCLHRIIFLFFSFKELWGVSDIVRHFCISSTNNTKPLIIPYNWWNIQSSNSLVSCTVPSKLSLKQTLLIMFIVPYHLKSEVPPQRFFDLLVFKIIAILIIKNKRTKINLF